MPGRRGGYRDSKATEVNSGLDHMVRKTKGARRNQLIALCSLVLAALLWYLYTLIGYWVILLFFIILAPIWYKLSIKVMRYKATRSFEGALGVNLEEILKIMDSVCRTYSSEDEASKELVCVCKAKGLDAEYQPVLDNGIQPDIRLGNTIIEAKLDLTSQDEADRLVGQVRRYLHRSNYKIGVVVYGALRDHLRRFLEEELPREIPLIYLTEASRVREYS